MNFKTPLKQWNSCQFAVLVELQSGGSDLWDPSCLLPPGSITLDAHFQGHLTNSAVEFDNGGNIPKEPHTAAAWAFVEGEACVCERQTGRKRKTFLKDLKYFFTVCMQCRWKGSWRSWKHLKEKVLNYSVLTWEAYYKQLQYTWWYLSDQSYKHSYIWCDKHVLHMWYARSFCMSIHFWGPKNWCWTDPKFNRIRSTQDYVITCNT